MVDIVILGALGGFGRAMSAEAARRGWKLRVLVRDEARAAWLLAETAAAIVVGDAQSRSDLARAIDGAAHVVHAVNYDYAHWDPAMREVTAKIIAACREARARLVFPGNVYGFDVGAAHAIVEGAPQDSMTRKGRMRAEFEYMIERATDDGAMRALIVRAGDFFGPSVRNGLVDRIFGNAAHGTPIKILGRLDAPHQWSFIDDVARLTADLVAISGQLAPFEIVHHAGHVAMRQDEFLRRVAMLAGHPALKLRVLPWWMLRLASLTNPITREILELRPLFDDALILDDPRRRALLPNFQPTALDAAIAATLASYRAG